MPDPIITSLGVIITVIGVVYNVPLTWRVWRNKSANDISPWFLGLRIINSILSIAYGGVIADPYVITTNAVPLISSIIVSYIWLRYKPKISKDHDDDTDSTQDNIQHNNQHDAQVDGQVDARDHTMEQKLLTLSSRA
jgi:uncharacterized protein with PQ loop repeat